MDFVEISKYVLIAALMGVGLIILLLILFRLHDWTVRQNPERYYKHVTWQTDRDHIDRQARRSFMGTKAEADIAYGKRRLSDVPKQYRQHIRSQYRSKFSKKYWDY